MDAITERSTLPEPDAKEVHECMLRMMRGVNAQAFRMFGNRVFYGPFAGMVVPQFNPNWDDGNSACKLFGSYEHELHEAIQTAVWRRPDVVVNAGCAEGYYAIGLARLLPSAEVWALDINEGSLGLCQEYAAINKVKVKTKAGAEKVEDLMLGDSNRRLYVLDIEGGEDGLMPEGFENSDLIVECHDFFKPMGAALAERFSATHRVERITARLPNFEWYPFLKQFASIMPVLAVVEKRPTACYWLACWANRKGT
jgi:hypothetical protein